jgi:hypothetical protein
LRNPQLVILKNVFSGKNTWKGIKFYWTEYCLKPLCSFHTCLFIMYHCCSICRHFFSSQDARSDFPDVLCRCSLSKTHTPHLENLPIACGGLITAGIVFMYSNDWKYCICMHVYVSACQYNFDYEKTRDENLACFI